MEAMTNTLMLFAVAQLFLMLAACAASSNLHGVCAEGQCTELSLPNHRYCYNTLTGAGEWTVRTNAEWLRNPPASNPFENSCSNTHCEDCHDTSRDLWPHLNITLEHYNEWKYGIVISWKQPVNVTGYVLLITMQPRSGRCGGGDMTGLNMCNCINITTANTTTHTYVDFYPPVGYRNLTALYIKLIPTPWCDGPSTSLPIPQTCHNIRPGDCETCGIQAPHMISPPTNVQMTLLPHLRGVFLTWEPGESYYGLPYPNISFFLKVTNAVNGSEATPRLQVLGRTNVTLQHFNLDVNYSVEIQAGDCGCGYDRSFPVYFLLNGSTLQNQPSSSTHPTLPPTSTDLPPPTHLSSSPSLSTHSHKVWPAVLAILLTCAGLVTIASIIFIAVMIYIYCRNCKKTRLPQSQLKNTGARTVLVYSMDTKEQQRWQTTSSEMRPLPAGQK